MLPKNLPAGTKVVCMKDYNTEMNVEEYEPNSIPRMGQIYEISEKKPVDVSTEKTILYGYFLGGEMADYFWWNAENFVLLSEFEPDD